MSNTTPYRIQVAGFVKNTTSTTAPSLTDPSLNSAYKNQVVTVAGQSYFVDSTGVAVKLGGGTEGAPVTVGTSAPTGTSIEGAIHLVTDDGTPTGTVLEQYIYDTDSATWIEMNRNAKSMLKFGTTAPTSPGDWDGEEFFVTSDGTSTGTVLAQYVYDYQTSTWVLRPAAKITTTSLTPVVYNGSAYVGAQANAATTLADLIRLSDGSYIHDGKVTWTGHGLTVGQWYYLSQTAAGAVITAEPSTGWVQQLFFVEDANTIHVDIEEGYEVNVPTGEDTTSPYMVTAYSTVNDSLLGGYTPQLNKYNVVDLANCLGGAGAAFNASAGFYRFTPTRAGWYDVRAFYDIHRGSGVESYISIRKNGVNLSRSGGYGPVVDQASRNIYMNGTTDYLDVINLGGAATSRLQTSQNSMFQARWLHY